MAIGTPVAGSLAENTTAATSLAVPYPAGISAGDLLLMWVAVSIASVPNLPAGWAPIVSGSSGTGSQSPSSRWYYKVATGSESGTQTVTSSSATSHGQMWRISGVDTTTPVDVTGTHTAAAIGGSTTHPGVTTTVAGCQVWASAMKNVAGSTYPTVTSPFTMTEVVDDGTPYPSTQVSYLTWAGSGATGTFTFGSDTSVRAGYDVFALRPAATSVSGSAAVTAPAATAAGSGTLTLTGTAATTTVAGQATGTATLTITGTGAVSAPAATATGTAASTVPGVAAVTATAPVTTATAVLVLTGAGAAQAPPATAAGVGTLTVTGAADVTPPPVTATGTGVLAVTGVGDGTAPAATGAGTGTLIVWDPPAPTPPERRLTVPAEHRVLTVPSEPRTLTVPPEPRVLEVR